MENKVKIDIQGDATVNSSDIETLCNIANMCTSDSRIVGTLTTRSARDSQINELITRFPNLIITSQIQHIDFKDKEVERILISKGYSVDGAIDIKSMARVTDISTWFQFSDVETLDDLNSTNVTELTYQAFKDCTKLKYVNLSKVKTFYGSFIGCTSILRFFSNRDHYMTIPTDIVGKNGSNPAETEGQLWVCYTDKTTMEYDVVNPFIKFFPYATQPSTRQFGIKLPDSQYFLIDYGKNIQKHQFANPGNNIDKFKKTSYIIRNETNVVESTPMQTTGWHQHFTLFVPEALYDEYKQDEIFSQTKLYTIGGSEWTSYMKGLAEFAIFMNLSDIDIENTDFSDPYVDYDIFDMPHPNY